MVYKIPQPVFIVCYLPCTLSHVTVHLHMERRRGGRGGGWQGSSRENKNGKENVRVCLCPSDVGNLISGSSTFSKSAFMPGSFQFT